VLEHIESLWNLCRRLVTTTETKLSGELGPDSPYYAERHEESAA
jgi:hypothetical protein